MATRVRDGQAVEVASVLRWSPQLLEPLAAEAHGGIIVAVDRYPIAASTSAGRGGERNAANPDAGPPRQLDWGSLRPVVERCQLVRGVVVRGARSCRLATER